MNKDYKIIKKNYGEEMAKFCRDNFPTILEEEGKLSGILLSTFAPNHNLYQDIIASNAKTKFIYFINKLNKRNKRIIKSTKSVIELFQEAGYDFYECKTKEDIDKFKKYYYEGEELCTFKENRLLYCHVFFAVKKDIDTIRREDFPFPEREDRYGTSVISIQFTKKAPNEVSIKNRYNHTVENPDATFSNNLDNIRPGLKDAFKREYHFTFKYDSRYLPSAFLKDYVYASDGKYYKYNIKSNWIYYCPNNTVIIHGIPKSFDKNEYLLIDCYLFDLKNKKVTLLDTFLDDSFITELEDINNISIINNNDTKIITIKTAKYQEEIEITVDKENRIISYKNNNTTHIGPFFMSLNKDLKSLECTKLETVEESFLERNINLERINTPNIQYIGSAFLSKNESLLSLYLPNVIEVEDEFLFTNRHLKELYVPLLKRVGNDFLYHNTKLSRVEFPNLEEIADYFLINNQALEELTIPKLRDSHNFFMSSSDLKRLSLPSLRLTGVNFLNNNQVIEHLYLPKVEYISHNFLRNNNSLTSISLPNLIDMSFGFLVENNVIRNINLPKVQHIGGFFLAKNITLENLYLPELTRVGICFLESNICLKHLYAPKLQIINNGFLPYNTRLEALSLPNVTTIGHNFLFNNKDLEEISLPKVEEIGEDFLFSNTALRVLDLPNLHKHGSNFLHSNNELAFINMPLIDDDLEKYIVRRK